MMLRDCTPWTQVKVWVSVYTQGTRVSALLARRVFPTDPQMTTIFADRESGGHLLVWKPGETAVMNSKPLGTNASPLRNSLENVAKVKGYDKGFWATDIVECELVQDTETTSIVVPTPKVEKILSCKRCGIFGEYFQPNQPDGSFICYSCRGS